MSEPLDVGLKEYVIWASTCQANCVKNYYLSNFDTTLLLRPKRIAANSTEKVTQPLLQVLKTPRRHTRTHTSSERRVRRKRTEEREGGGTEPLLRSSCFFQQRESKDARWQNMIPSFPWIVSGWRAGGHNPRKGRDHILQCSIAEP